MSGKRLPVGRLDGIVTTSDCHQLIIKAVIGHVEYLIAVPLTGFQADHLVEKLMEPYES